MGRKAQPDPSLDIRYWVVRLPNGFLKTSSQRANRCQPCMYRTFGLAIRVAKNIPGSYVYEISMKTENLYDDPWKFMPDKWGKYHAT